MSEECPTLAGGAEEVRDGGLGEAGGGRGWTQEHSWPAVGGA